MIIKELQMQNFGRHAEIHFKCGAPVVGLLGPNGVGKSTVLDAIEFAITGEARDPLPSYVRHGEGNAAVSLTFIKNGMEGYIFRQFGKTTKRKLVWDGRTITAAREVDTTMATIFGADKQAIANAVFINQGALEKILFAGEADRRALFIRLVNMGFCEQTANMLDGKIKKIQTTVVDLGPALDASVLLVQQTDAARVEQQNAYALLRDHTEDWNFCDRFIRNEDQLKQVLGQLATIENQTQLIRAQYHGLLLAEAAPAYIDLQKDMLRWETELRTQQIEFDGWKSIKGELLHYQRLTSEINEDLRQLQAAQKRRADLNPTQLPLTSISIQIEACAKIIDTEMERRRLVTQLEGTKEALSQAEKRYQDRPISRETWQQISERQSQIAQLEQTANTLAAFLSKQKEFAQCTQMKIQRPEGGVQCVQCGLIISNPEALSEQSLQGMEKAVADLRVQLDALRKAHQELKQDWERCDQEAKTRGAVVANLRETQTYQSANLMAYRAQDITETEKSFRLLSEMRNVLPEIDSSIGRLNQDVARLMTDRATYTKALSNLDRATSFTDAEERKQSDELNRRQERFKQRQTRFDEITRLHTILGTLQQQMDQHLTDKEKLTRALEEPMPAAVTELSVALQGNLTSVRAELQARNEARSSAYGRLTQAVEAANQAVASHQELLRRVKADEEKLKLIEDLTILRDTLRPNGLPLAVVRYHFSHLATLTQEALNQLGANFSIQIDHENPLSFKFSRLDEPEHEPLPMNKLSGGQRIRLCTAFLIAVQRRLVKEVGLLVLDEPSTHVDQAGVESLAELLSTLGAQLRNTETQIFVSDHHPSLKNCFTRVLDLA